MTQEDLYDAITNVKDPLVDEASQTPPLKKPAGRSNWAGITAAAALALVIAAGGWALSRWRPGGNAPNAPTTNGTALRPDGWGASGSASNAPEHRAPAPSAGEGNGGLADSTPFMSYAGPVLPLTALEGGGELQARRELTFDFSPWTGTWRSDLLVTDSYTLINPTGEDKTLTLLYPFVSSLREVAERTPALTAEGEARSAALRAGGYAGGFQGVPGGQGDGSEAQLNLAKPGSWEAYRALLSDGRYLDAALGEYPDLSGVPVTVYKFTGAYGPEPDEKAGRPNPSIRASFDLDYDRTTVLSYGFHGGRYDRENGKMIQEFSIPQQGEPGYGEAYFLYVLGDDLQALSTGGYVTGGTDDGTPKLEDCGVTVERYETDLESALAEAAELMFRREDWGTSSGETGGEQPDFHLYFGLMKEFLCSCGPLAENGSARYHTGWLEDLDFVHVDRVFYLETEVTVPAGESAVVTARSRKEASFDFFGARTEGQDLYGYDMLTTLGSSLTFTAQTARTENTGGLELVRQNCGFDWDEGVDEVALDPAAEHYFLEVRRTGQPE